MRIFVPGACLFAAASAAFAAGADDLRFFHEQVAPLLVKNCAECHNTNTHKGDLSLETLGDALKGGENGAALVPGKPEESPLFTKLIPESGDEKPEMPKKKAALAKEDVEKIRRWIMAGAPWPKEIVLKEKAKGNKTWWSLQKLSHPSPPEPAALPAAWSHSPIDRFVFSKLAEKGLAPNPPADPREFIRRVTYDLTGLPPTPEESAAFAGECAASLSTPQAERAIEKLVDRLLASPHYGEQWGRHWLDVVRFGESRGFERNLIIDDAWPFRDYVIRSLNEDKPFDRFIEEHLAGDVIGKNHPEVEVGAAFLTLGPYDDVGNQDPVAAANIRAATLDDVITATGTAFLGLSVNCAHCHDHKFDPIPQADYYRLRAAFEGVKHGDRVLATREEKARHEAAVAPLEKQKQALAQKKEALEKVVVNRPTPQESQPMRPAASAHLTEERFAPVTARFIKLVMLSTSDLPNTGANARLDEFEAWTAEPAPRNVALASAGGKASGPTGRTARDFAGAYGSQHVNDGKFGARWIVGSPARLTVEFQKAETIDHVVFSHDRTANSDKPVTGLGPCLVEYEIQVSNDGSTWQKVADSYDRKPFSPAIARERRLRAASPEERKQLAALTRQIKETDAALAAVPALPLVWAGTFSQPATPTFVFRGGDPQKPAEEVKPASLKVLDQVTKPYELPADAPEAQRRLALAQWIVSKENPLTPRVLANRVWEYHFGAGLVDTPSDFGFLGTLPSHPELLDWLASRLTANGWHLKALHRDICLSQAYRQSAAWRKDGAAVDKDARLLWRFPPRRLAAEEMRDTMLSITGQMDPRMGGPGFRLYDYKNDNVSTYVPLDHAGPETYRRAVYHQNARASVVDLLSDFDLPDNAASEPKRSSTTTPLQTLTLLNQSFTLDMAKALAERIQRESSATDAAAQVARAYALCFQRAPSEKEKAACLRLIQSHGLPALCRALLNANELIYLP